MKKLTLGGKTFRVIFESFRIEQETIIPRVIWHLQELKAKLSHDFFC